MTDNVTRALRLAALLHEGQKDKGGHPYILHLMRVGGAGRTELRQVAGLLHDSVEDGKISLETIEKNYGKPVALVVDRLTRRKGESYDDFIARCGEDPESAAVKIEDLKDNMDMSRLPRTTEKDLARHEKYTKALQYLTGIQVEVYTLGDNDQPTTCPMCGARTEFYDLAPGSKLVRRQRHVCLDAAKCGYSFIMEEIG